MNQKKLYLAISLFFATTGNSSAALFDRGNGLIYDDFSNITWTANANLGGLLNWTDANTWAAALTFDRYSGWRLPTADAAAIGLTYNEINTELGHLFYIDLGVAAGNPITSSISSNLDFFSNLQGVTYWLGTSYAIDPTHAWDFDMNDGSQDPSNKTKPHYVWAVHDGDIAAVPVPSAVWLFVTGLVGLLRIKYHRL